MSYVNAQIRRFLGSRSLGVSSHANYKSDLREFADWLSGRDLEQIPRDALDGYISSLYNNYSKATAKRKASVVRNFYEFSAGQHEFAAANLPATVHKLIPFVSLAFLFAAIVLTPKATFTFNSKAQAQLGEGTLPVDTASEGSDFSKASGIVVVEVPPPIEVASQEYIAAQEHFIKNSKDVSLPEEPKEDFGTALIPAGSTSAIVESRAVDEGSSVIVTPVDEGSVLFVTNQKDGAFTVGLTEKADKDIKFHWLVKTN